jgi:succinate dehydrogenase / fumarate reductase flavoprotein subunit
MQISPAPHFTMGGLWVDYHLRTNLGGLFAIGEANCSDHGANRLGANSLLQTMVDGCFVLPRTLAHELACTGPSQIAPDHPQFADCALQCQQQTSDWLARSGTQSAGQIHRRLGDILWREVGVCRSREGLLKALDELQNLAHEFDTQLTVPGHRDSLNAELERAGRVYDFLQLGRLMGLDALRREESCGAHFRQEHQDEQGHPVRNDQDFAHVAVWEWGQEPVLHTESLEFEAVTRVTRQYKQS